MCTRSERCFVHLPKIYPVGTSGGKNYPDKCYRIVKRKMSGQKKVYITLYFYPRPGFQSVPEYIIVVVQWPSTTPVITQLE